MTHLVDFAAPAVRHPKAAPDDRLRDLLAGQPTWRVVGDQVAVPCVFMRGGTSRGAFFRASDMPSDHALRERIIAAIYGSPDRRQIDGLGGADPLTSKVAIVGPSNRADADVDFTFGQVRITEPKVDFDGNCGNMSAAVGPFAIDEGMVPAQEPRTRVRIHLTNTDKVLEADVPVREGRAAVEGDSEIPGVPGRGAAILLDLAETGGTLGRGVLPTGSVCDVLMLRDGSRLAATIVDAGNPCVFVNAAEVGAPFGRAVLGLVPETFARLEEIRGEAAVRVGLVTRAADAAATTPAVPKIYWVGPPADYEAVNGRAVSRDKMSFAGAGLSMARPHQAYAVTAAVATAVAAMLPGSLVHAVCDARAVETGLIRIGHPSGVLGIEAAVRMGTDGIPSITRVAVERTARRIMDGVVYVPLHVLQPR